MGPYAFRLLTKLTTTWVARPRAQHRPGREATRSCAMRVELHRVRGNRSESSWRGHLSLRDPTALTGRSGHPAFPHRMRTKSDMGEHRPFWRPCDILAPATPTPNVHRPHRGWN